MWPGAAGRKRTDKLQDIKPVASQARKGGREPPTDDREQFGRKRTGARGHRSRLGPWMPARADTRERRRDGTKRKKREAKAHKAAAEPTFPITRPSGTGAFGQRNRDGLALPRLRPKEAAHRNRRRPKGLRRNLSGGRRQRRPPFRFTAPARRPRPHSKAVATCRWSPHSNAIRGSPRRCSISSVSAHTIASARSGEAPGP